MQLQIEIRGDVVERQELLNGTEIVALEGESRDGDWSMSGGLSWSIGPADAPPEGDLTLTHTGGDEVFATLTEGTVRAADAVDDADFVLAVTYEIDGGSGPHAEAGARLQAEGALSGDTFTLAIRVPAQPSSA